MLVGIVIVIGKADSDLALLRGPLLGLGVGLGRLVVLVIVSSAAVGAGASCTILGLAAGLGDDLATFELEAVGVDDGVDLAGPVWGVGDIG